MNSVLPTRQAVTSKGSVARLGAELESASQTTLLRDSPIPTTQTRMLKLARQKPQPFPALVSFVLPS